MNNQEIALLAEGLPIGASRGGNICPYCGGGQSKERSLSVTRTTTAVLFKCHRASCGAKGYVGSWGSTPVHSKPEPKQELNLIALPKEKEVYLGERYGIRPEALEYFRVRYHEATDSIAYPNYSDSVYLNEIGVQLRNYETKKIDSQWPRGEVGGFYSYRGRGRLSNDIAIVEDPVSAIKLSEVLDTFCLFGTTLNEEKVCLLVNENYTRAFIHLDWDARAKSLKYKRDYGIFFKQFVPVFTFRDPKDTKLEELKEIYGGADTWSRS